MLTTEQIAARVGVSPRRLWQIAKSRGIEPVMRVRGAALWSPSQERFMRPRKPGRPRKRPWTR